MDDLRETQYNDFEKVSLMSSRPGTAKVAYNKIDEEVKNIKDRV